MANPVLDGILRGFQLAQQIRGQRAMQQRNEAMMAREERIGQENEQRRARMEAADLRARELQNFDTAQRIRKEGGRRLTPQQRAMLDEGGDFSMELAPGFATTASSADRFDIDGQSFLLPQQQDAQRAQFMTALGQKEEEAEIGTVPIPEQLAGLMGVAPGTRGKVSDFDDFQRTFGPKPEKIDERPEVPSELARKMGLPDGSRATVAEIANLYRAANANRPKTQAAKEDPNAEFAEMMGDFLSDYTTGEGEIDVDRAIAAASRASRKDPKVKRHLAKIVTELRKLKPREAAASRGQYAMDDEERLRETEGAIMSVGAPATAQAATREAQGAATAVQPPAGANLNPKTFDKLTPFDVRDFRTK